ncbi:MAG: Gx transporter family protein [Treponemataceae bacterium]|nr:Gx transporter family protein [Treponemataceae bacterium]
MQFQNKKKIAYLSALTLLFSYAELLLPRIIPFFRLGLGNTVILLAFEMPFPAFFLLSVIKAVASSLMGGTLFSPFFLISLSQSVSSALLMQLLFKLNKACNKKIMSIYGISLAGSALSAFVQIFLCSLFLGQGTFSLLGPMLLFNTASGIITAFIAEKMKSLNEAENPKEEGSHPQEEKTALEAASLYKEEKSEKKQKKAITQILLAAVIIGASAGIFFIDNIPLLCAAFVLSILLQLLSGRKLFILPHISLWLFVLISSLFTPNGKVLFSMQFISITEGALMSGIEKALKLSAVSALSQCAASLRPPEKSLLGLSLSYYRKLSDRFRDTKGNIFTRLKATLGSNQDFTL